VIMKSHIFAGCLFGPRSWFPGIPFLSLPSQPPNSKAISIQSQRRKTIFLLYLIRKKKLTRTKIRKKRTSLRKEQSPQKDQKEQRASDNFCHPLPKTIIRNLVLSRFEPSTLRWSECCQGCQTRQANHSSSRSVRSLNPLTTVPSGRD
jgi:hypothetical protein